MTEQEKARAAKTEYMRRWRAKNKDKVRRNNENYWARRFGKMQERAEPEQKEGRSNDPIRNDQ